MNLTPTKTYNAQTGNLASKAGVSYTYADTAHKHAVTSLSNGNAYTYDANGNQTRRITSNGTYDLTYDGENRLVSVIKDSSTVASFVYNGDGARGQSTINGVVTAFVGNHLEWTGSATTMKKYYYAGSQRVAMRTGSSTLNFILGDHLGSTSLTTSGTGAYQSETLYKPWGEVRYTSGTLPTKYTFTGQYSYASNSATDFGLLYYNARWVDPALGRFAQADTLIPSPSDPQSWDRFVYINNNPVNGTDSSGHCIDGLTTVPCLIALIAISGFAGGAAIHEFNVSGNSWWESKEDAAATFDSGMKGATIALVAADVAVKAAVTGNFALEEAKAAYNSALKIGPFPSVGGDPAKFGASSSPAVQPYEVGTYEDLNLRSVPGDNIQIHHAPQAHPAGQVIPSYDYPSGPAIALPNQEHFNVNSQNIQGTYNGSPSVLFGKTINDLRNFTNVSDQAIQNLQNLWKVTWPNLFK